MAEGSAAILESQGILPSRGAEHEGEGDSADSGPGRHVAHFYAIRVATTLAALAVGLYYVLQFGRLGPFEILVFGLGLLYPHVAYFLQSRLELGRRVEHATLMVDAFVGGCVVYLLGFSLLPSMAVVLITLVNPVAFTGWSLIGWTTLAAAAGIGLPTALIGPNFAPRDVATVNVAVGLLLFVYYGLFAHAVFLRTVALQASRRELRRQRIDIEIGKKRSDSLLLSLMPASAVAEFQRTGKAGAWPVERAGLMAMELAGFVGDATGPSPSSLFAEVNLLVQSLDAICARHGLYVLEAAGGVRLAMGGMEGPAPDGTDPARSHADPTAAAVAAAREIRRFLDAENASRQAGGLGSLSCRLAIHQGPVTAGLVEGHKVAYRVMGAAVNEVLALCRAGPTEAIVVSAAAAAHLDLIGEVLPAAPLGSEPRPSALVLRTDGA